MIVICLSGGLGNQLFQYAFGMALALKNKTDLYLYDGWLKTKRKSITHRQYKLNHFKIDAKIATPEILEKFQDKSFFRKIEKIILKKESYEIHQNFSIGFDINLINITPPVFIEGYFQSPNYFNHIRSLLLNQLKLKNEEILSDKEKKFIKIIQQFNSVAIHIRRGDYFSNTATNQLHGICTVEYYQKAIDYIKHKLEHKIIFLIFSDDNEWVKKNILIDEEYYFATEFIENKDYLELLCMGYCRHQIISNSSFSWWAAWLNTNEDKLVLCPKYWYKGYETKSIDLIPENWITLE